MYILNGGGAKVLITPKLKELPRPTFRLKLPLLGATMLLSYVRFRLTVMEKWSLNVFTHICTCSGDVLYPLLSFLTHYLHSGRCYASEICTILFLLRCPFIWYPFWPKSKFSDFGQKPWTIIRRFYRNRGDFLQSFYSTVEGATKLKFAPFCPLEMPFHMVSFFLPKSNFQILAKNHGL